jgi:hypothetical protein
VISQLPLASGFCGVDGGVLTTELDWHPQKQTMKQLNCAADSTELNLKRNRFAVNGRWADSSALRGIFTLNSRVPPSCSDSGTFILASSKLRPAMDSITKEIRT